MSDNVLAFPKSNLSDIPYMLRKLADDIEAGIYGEISLCLALLPELEEPLFGFGPDGNTSDAALIGHLELAKAGVIKASLSE